MRTQLVDFAADDAARATSGFEQFDVVAGGETAGIPYAAWIADRLGLPMQYVRKKPKGFGRNAQIEGDIARRRAHAAGRGPHHRRALARSISARRCATRAPSSTTCSSYFYYDIFPESKKILADLNVKLHYLATWWDVLRGGEEGRLPRAPRRSSEVESFLHAPAKWSAAHGGVSAFPAA